MMRRLWNARPLLFWCSTVHVLFHCHCISGAFANLHDLSKTQLDSVRLFVCLFVNAVCLLWRCFLIYTFCVCVCFIDDSSPRFHNGTNHTWRTGSTAPLSLHGATHQSQSPILWWYGT
jgi:hypothetical protein